MTSTIGYRAASMTSSSPMQDMSKSHTFSQNGRLVPPFPNPATNYSRKIGINNIIYMHI
jgi:hypothetical protein